MSSLKQIVSAALSAQSTAMVTLSDIKKLEAETALKEKEIQLRESDLKLAEKQAEILRLELALLAAKQQAESNARC
ncbi:hypothetical protein V1515DRAFT_578899 [Lipomyces mesembrius]